MEYWDVGMLNVLDFLPTMSAVKKDKQSQVLYPNVTNKFLKSQTERNFFSSILNFAGNL